MPDQNGNLTNPETEQALAFLRDNWGQWRCPASGHREYVLQPTIVQLEPYNGGNAFFHPGPGRLIYPMLIVSCAYCGYSVLVSAIQAGLLQQAGYVPDQPG
jgi:hypothetical protein